MEPASHLTWRFAEPKDEASLNRFVCADPAKPKYDKHRGHFHPNPYQLEAQSALRGLHCPPKSGRLYVCLDGAEVVGACHYGYGEIEGQFFIWSVATSLPYRRRGIGDRLIRDALEDIRAWRDEEKRTGGVFTRIDKRNKPSQVLFSQRGFSNLGDNEIGELDFWVHDLLENHERLVPEEVAEACAVPDGG